MAQAAAGRAKRVVIMVQENHTVDNYFRGLAPYGGNVATDWPTSSNPPPKDQPHDRHAYFEWLTKAGTATHEQFDTASALPYYLYLAVTGAFLENHCSQLGTNSTPNHLIIVWGQSPTLKNPSQRQPAPLWDMPSLPGLAEAHRLSWRVYAASGEYPVGFYTQLKDSTNVVDSAQFLADAKGGPLPSLVMLWHNSPGDEHPPENVTTGMELIWQSVDAVVHSGGWDETVFMLTWDDWGGYDDHVETPVLEYTPDNVQLAYGPRVPLLMFGGAVKQTIDNRWCGHASIPKTAVSPRSGCRGSTRLRAWPTSSTPPGRQLHHHRRLERRSPSRPAPVLPWRASRHLRLRPGSRHPWVTSCCATEARCRLPTTRRSHTSQTRPATREISAYACGAAWRLSSVGCSVSCTAVAVQAAVKSGSSAEDVRSRRRRGSCASTGREDRRRTRRWQPR